MTLDQFWRCPSCGCGQALGSPATYTAPPFCGMCKREMEQTTAEGFAADLDRPEGSGG